MRHTPVEAVALRSWRSKEADKIILLFTRELGKVRCLARGITKINSKFGPVAELFTHSSMLLYKKNPNQTIYTLTQCQIKAVNSGIRLDWEHIETASAIAKLVDIFTQDYDPNEALFELLLTVIEDLSKSNPPYNLLIICFWASLLKLIGLQPYLTGCIRCHRNYPGGVARFSPEEGGLVCKQCSVKGIKGLILEELVINFFNLTYPEMLCEIMAFSPKDKYLLLNLLKEHTRIHLPDAEASKQFMSLLKGNYIK